MSKINVFYMRGLKRRIIRFIMLERKQHKVYDASLLGETTSLDRELTGRRRAELLERAFQLHHSFSVPPVLSHHYREVRS